MKKLIISMKPSAMVLEDFKKALKEARKGKLKEDHHELSFDNKKDFDRFVKNLGILQAIAFYKPKSIYELAKAIGMDVSNLNKLIDFFQEVGVVTIKSSTQQGRNIKTPIMEFERIEFDLKVA